jgi:hypothetical protein
MNFQDFITQDEIDDLPEDHEYAFAEFVRLAQRRLNERMHEIPDDNEHYHWIEDARHGFMNATLAVAKRFNIQGIGDLEVPRIENFRSEDFRQFQRDVDFYLAQLMIGNSYKSRGESVAATENTASKIQSYIHKLREVVDRSPMSDAKREALNAHLDALEKELRRKRIRYLVIAVGIVEILRLPGELGESWDSVCRLTSQIWSVIAEAKTVENDQRKLPDERKPVALLPPRAPEEARRRGSVSASDLDDEIPF